MMMKWLPGSSFSLCLFLAGCSPDAGPPGEIPVAPEPLTGEQRAEAVALGKAVTAEAFSLLSSNLLSAIAAGGVTNALPYCSLAASPLTASVADQHGVSLKRVTHRPRNPAARANATEAQALAQFEADLQAGQAPEPLVTNLLAGQATFFAPIVLNKELCLKCHGRVDGDMDSETLAVLNRLYPQDEAREFQLGELRGAWRVDIPMNNLAPVVHP